MQLSELLDYTLGAIINTMCYVIIMKKVFGTQLNSSKIKIYLSLIIGSFILAIVNIQSSNIFKPLITIPIMATTVKFITNQKIFKSFFSTILSMFYLFAAELLSIAIISILPIESALILGGNFGSTFGNSIVAMFSILLINITPISKKLKNIMIWVEKKQKIGLLIIFLFLVGALASKLAYNLEDIEVIITNIILSIIFILIILLLINEYQKKEELSNNYNMLFSYLNVYEKELVEKRKIIHDYNNQLIIINGYTHNNNKKLKRYINSIIKEQENIKNNSIVKDSDKIPAGLKGLMCYKLALITKEINVKLAIDEMAQKIKIPEESLKDALKITGIFLDNAIEAAKNSKEKNLFISINAYKSKLSIEFKNSFDNYVDEKNIYNNGYSTKGNKRGYGLALAKDIVNKNKKIKIAIKIINKTFIATQIIYF